jgi:TPR repeat protein
MKATTTTVLALGLFLGLAGAARADGAPRADGAARADGAPRADGAELAIKCRETADQSVCAAAAFPLEASSPEAALELTALACAKRPADCSALIAYAERALKKREGARAAQLFDKGCDLRAARACATLAAELEEGERGIAQDLVKAARLHDKACELGTPRSCLLLAIMVEDGRGVRRDAARAAKLRARGEAPAPPSASASARPPAPAGQLATDEAQCRKGQDASRCLAAGLALAESDAVKAEELFRVGCTVDKAMCGLWGFALDRLRRDDPTRATRILEEGCSAGAGLACLALAELNHSGFRAIARNEMHAAELYDKACTAGEPAGCRATAARYRGVKDAARADELRARAAKLEADADTAAAPLREAWLKDAAQSSAREPYMREAERRYAEWRALTQRARARWAVRMQRLAEVDAGTEPEPLPAAPASDGEASAVRRGAIQRMAKALFP